MLCAGASRSVFVSSLGGVGRAFAGPRSRGAGFLLAFAFNAAGGLARCRTLKG